MTDDIHTTQNGSTERRRGGRKASSARIQGEVAGSVPEADQPLNCEEDLQAAAKAITPIPFDFQDRAIRTVTEEGQVWFVAEDVCAVLEHSNSRMAISGLDDDEKGVRIVYTLGGPQRMNTVNESGLFHLISTSQMPKAKAFRRWVTGVLLPTLRRTGQFDMRGRADPAHPFGEETDSRDRNSIPVALPGPGRYLVVLYHDGERRIEPLSFAASVSALAALDCRSIAYTHLTAASFWEKLQHVRSVKGDGGRGVIYDQLSSTMQAGAELARQILYTYDKPIWITNPTPGTAGERG